MKWFIVIHRACFCYSPTTIRWSCSQWQYTAVVILWWVSLLITTANTVSTGDWYMLATVVLFKRTTGRKYIARNIWSNTQHSVENLVGIAGVSIRRLHKSILGQFKFFAAAFSSNLLPASSSHKLDICSHLDPKLWIWYHRYVDSPTRKKGIVRTPATFRSSERGSG